mgnify:CR=1 FL=1
MIQQDFGHLICQPKVPTKFENLPILRGFCLKSHIFESCHLDQMQNGLDAKSDAFEVEKYDDASYAQALFSIAFDISPAWKVNEVFIPCNSKKSNSS